MAQHILDIDLPSEAPTGAPGNDFQRIPTSPSMFGGLTGQAQQTLGAGLEKAGETGIDLLTQDAQRANALHAVDVKSWYADQLSTMHASFMNLEGRAANDELQNYKDKAQSLRDEALGRVTSPIAKAQLAGSLSSLQDQYWRYWAGHAGQQLNTYDKTVTGNAVASNAGRAVNAILAGDEVNTQRALNDQDNEVRNFYSAQHYAPDVIEQEVAKRRGVTLDKAIMTVANGGNLRRANELFDKYKSRMDAASIADVTGKLKTANTKLTAIGIVDKELGPVAPVNAVQPQLDQIGGRYGISGSYLARTHQLEGNGVSVTGAAGPFQFTKGTAAKYGLADPNDFRQSADAAARLAADNKAQLTKELGRAPTDAELYIAHQQGAGGAAALLMHPGLSAVDALAAAYGGDRVKAAQAVSVNGGDPNAPAAQFTSMWMSKFDGASGAIQSPFTNQNKSDVIARVLDRPDLRDNPLLRDAVVSEVNRRFVVQQSNYIDQERKWQIERHQQQEAYKQGTDELLSGLINNDPAWTAQRVMADPRFAFNREHALALLQSKTAGQQDIGTYGAGFYKLFQQIHAPDGDPNKITDPSILYNHIGPNGDLTLRGMKELMGEISSRHTAEGEADAAMRKQFLANAKGQISGSNEGLHLRDPKGDELFLKFLAQFYPAYQKGRNEGKTAGQLLSPDSPDYLGKSIGQFKRPLSQWTRDMMSAAGQTQQGALDLSTPQGLIAAVQGGKVTRAEGEKIALQKGWIRANPVSNEPQVPMSR